MHDTVQIGYELNVLSKCGICKSNLTIFQRQKADIECHKNVWNLDVHKGHGYDQEKIVISFI